jgi:hypothetical protein
VLGNVTAHSEAARIDLVNQYNCLEPLVKILLDYVQRDKDSKLQNSTESINNTEVPVKAPTKKEIEDVLVKLIRLIANLSITEAVGPEIAKIEELTVLYELLRIFQDNLSELTMTETKTIQNNEELVLNVIGAITNLSYYSNESNNSILRLQYPISERKLLLLP